MGWTPLPRLAGAAALAVLMAAGVPALASEGGSAPTCGSEPTILTGTVSSEQLHEYVMLPVEVPEGAERIEVSYAWVDRPLAGAVALPSTPLTATVLDLGLWDEDGYRAVTGFRGWSGSRGGRSADKPVYVQADAADRGYLPGPLGAGTWWVELGVGAISPSGADYTVTVRCVAAHIAPAVARGAVDPNLVVSTEPGWYHGDLHMHGYHSNARGPSWADFAQQARAAGLDFLPVTDYVTSAHWDELGPAQAANPDVLFWPGREIITYHGHANTLGETPSVIDYRHGFEDVTLRAIQAAAKADGALFQVNHPTLFPGPLGPLCRGCEFRLGDEIDWGQVDTLEVLTGPIEVNATDAGGPDGIPLTMENPFVTSAIQLWEQLLLDGHKITAVSGSDSKGVEATPEERRRAGYGSSATAVHARELSRDAIAEALREGRAYVRTRGAIASPELDLVARAGRKKASFGGTLRAEIAQLEVTVRHGAGQTMRVYRNGNLVSVVPIIGDDFFYTTTIHRQPSEEGPLGTFWRVETADAKVRTTVANPVFLRSQPPGLARG